MTRLRSAAVPWLLLLPAMVLLVAFTHWPALATLWSSAFSTPKRGRPARFIGIENYRAMADDEVFRQAVWNNLVYAVATVPLSIAIAIAMALWVNGRLRGRGFLRLAYFTPTVLPMIAVANIWRLGIKELWSLVRDPMMLVLIVYTFTVSIYVAATAMPESLHKATIAIVDEDDSPLSARIVASFNPMS